MFTIHLIGIGPCPAKLAGQIKVGDVITYNYGHQYTVTGRRLCGNKSVNIDMVSNKVNAAGEHFRSSQRFLKSRLVAAETPKEPKVKMVQGKLRMDSDTRLGPVSALTLRFERAATDEFKAMLADKVRQLTEGGVTEALAIVEVRKLWLEALR